MVKIPVSNIVVPEVRASSRLTPEQQAFFKGTVEKYGVLQDILVRPLPDGRYELIAGKTRLDELKLRGVSEVEVKVVEANTKDALMMHIAENWARGSVDPISTARVIRKALDEGATVDEIAQIFNHRPEWVRFMIGLLELSPAYQKALQNGEIKVTHIREALRLPDLREADAALSAAIHHGWSTSVMHHYVNNRLAELEAARLVREKTGVELPPPPPEPERLVKYGQCLVCGCMVPRETLRLPTCCDECHELSRYVVSQVGTGEQAMQRIYRALEQLQAFEALQRQAAIQATIREQQQPTPSPSALGVNRFTLPERSAPISDDKLRAEIRRILRDELEKQQR